MAVVLIIAVCLLYWHHKVDSEKAKSAQVAPLPHVLPADAVKSAKVAVKPEYDFYQLLPKLQVTPTTKPLPLDSAAGTDRQYWLQIAASKNLSDVNRLLRRLNAAGFSAQLQQPQQDTDLYRVVMGPYEQQGRANQNLKRLRAYGLNGYILVKKLNNKS